MVAHLAAGPIVAIGAGVVGLGLVLASAKKASAAVHPNALGTAPSVKGTTGGEVVVPPGLPLVIKPPANDIKPPAKIVPQALPPSPAGNPIHVIGPTNVDTGAPTLVYNVATNGKAVARAHALYDFLVKNGPHSDGTTAFADLTKAFQVVHNSDPDAVKLSTQHKIPEDGTYDQLTSGALSLYTGHPVPPNPIVPPPPPMTPAQISDPKRTTPVQSPAAYSSFNLYSYLKIHGNDKSAALKPLVKAFQHDVNTDPAFPGPISYSGVKVISTPLTEDGLYGQNTYKALASCTMDTPKP
jgi:hypothetical protein